MQHAFPTQLERRRRGAALKGAGGGNGVELPVLSAIKLAHCKLLSLGWKGAGRREVAVSRVGKGCS